MRYQRFIIRYSFGLLFLIFLFLFPNFVNYICDLMEDVFSKEF